MWPFNLLYSRKIGQKYPRANHRRPAGRSRRSTVQLGLEALEDRVLMTADPAYFTTQANITQGVTDIQLYKGTPSGNTFIKDFGNDSLYGLTVVGNIVYFNVAIPAAGGGVAGNELWVSDGTSSGTHEVYDAGTSTIGNPMLVGNKLEFTLTSSTPSGNDTQLWVSDGTSGGTSLVADLKDASIQSQQVIGSRFYFTAFTPPPSGTANVDVQLYVSDSTSSGTVSLADTGSGQAAAIYGLTAAGSKLVFVMTNGSDDTQLWATNGTKSGTGMVFDAGSNSINNPSGIYQPIVAAGPNVYFDESTPDPPSLSGYDNQLLVSNLTRTGYNMLKDFGASQFNSMVAAGNQVYFNLTVYTSSNTVESQLWTATPAGATQLLDEVVDVGGEGIGIPVAVGRGRFKTNPKRQRGRPSLALRVSEGSFETVSNVNTSIVFYSLYAEPFAPFFVLLGEETMAQSIQGPK